MAPPLWHQLETRFDARPNAVSDVRRTVRECMTRWGLTELEEDAVLVSSELAANAVMHGAGASLIFSLKHTREGLRIEVSDGSRSRPKLRSTSPEDEHGRGLQLVNTLASRWGVAPLPDGKATWCLLQRPSHEPDG